MIKAKRVRHHVNPMSDLTEHKFAGFENDNPIIVDVGADRGEFTEGLLKYFGNSKNFIVFEIRKPLARRLEEKFFDNKNVIVFDGDANRNFKNILQTSIDRGISIEEIYINFPDPWFKKRHKKRRVINEKFLKDVQKWIKTGTKWIFQTDQKQLFDETIEMLEEIGNIKIDFFDKPPYNITTKWEDAKVDSGHKINRMKFNFL